MPARTSGLTRLQESLRAGAAGALYVLLGPNNRDRRLALGLLRDSVLAAGNESVPIRQGRAGESDIGRMLDDARTLPMAADRRLVILHHGEELKKEDLSLLADYARQPQETTCFVLVADTLPRKSAAVKAILATANCIDCPALRSYEMPRWITEEIRRRGYTFDTGVPELLHEILGDDQDALAAGIEKVLIFLGEEGGKQVGLEDVASVLARIPHGTVWQFIESLEDRDGARALAGLEAILELGEPVESVLRLIDRSRRQLLVGLQAQTQGLSPDEVLEAMGVHPRARAAPRLRRAILGRLAKQSRREILGDFERLLEADSRLKGAGPGGPREVLARLVLDMTGHS